MTEEASPANIWVQSYLDALLSYGLSSEYVKDTNVAKSRKAPDADRSMYSRYYVQSLLHLSEEALHNAWVKAASANRQGGEKDARLQYLSWRVWFMRRRRADVQRARTGLHEDESAPHSAGFSSDEDELPSPGTAAAEALGKAEVTDVAPLPTAAAAHAARAGGEAAAALPKPKKQLSIKVAATPAERTRETAFEAFDELRSPVHETPPTTLNLESHFGRLYVILISLHGLIRGDRMELGRDSDTGGQVKYVVELAKALSKHPAVFRVDLLTRLIRDPKVDEEYGQEEECMVKGMGEMGGAYIVRLPCGPVNKYVRKELLWPHAREFADRGVAHASRMLAAMADSGRRCELYAVHGHYADAGEVAVLMSSTLDVGMMMTGHSLGRNKLEHLLASGSMTRSEIEETYAIGRRIEAEERCLDNALMVFTSTQQEIDEQWGLYDGYNPQLSRVLRFRRSLGRHMPQMKVIPPGLDFSNLKVNIPEDPVLREFEDQRRAMQEMDKGAPSPRAVASPGKGAAPDASPPSTPSADSAITSVQSPKGAPDPAARPQDVLDPMNGPPIWREIARFLRNPLKPAVLAMSRPDTKKNLTTLVKAFGEHSMLRELANLVLVMGNRDNIDSMASGSQKVLVQVLKMIDAYDIYGSVAYPKHHTQNDISDIYLFAQMTRGVFVNPALQEPFGLTVIEAAAHGVPTVATKNGGPVDIMATLHHGVVVDPTDSDAVAAALLKILTNPQMWDTMSVNGVKNIMAYSWPSHCKRCLESIEQEKRFIKGYRKHDRTMSGLLHKRILPGPPEVALEEHDVLASPGPDISLTRYFSTPQPYPHTLPDVPGVPGGGGLRQTISGMSNDDLALIQSVGADLSSSSSSMPLGQQRKKFVVLHLNADYCLPEVAPQLRAVVEQLKGSDADQSVGIGLLSMLGFESTTRHLQKAGINRDALDFMICNSGGDIWVRMEDGRWDADEQYESTIDFEWDRISLHRTLKKIISGPDEDLSSGRLPRLKELLYNVQEEPAGGVHPRHICLELDPETQGILAIGMGPRKGGVRLTVAVVDRLKRRLRSKGFRASYTLQMVPREGTLLSVLHITPIRASRSLALRFLAQKFGHNMGQVAFVAVVPEVQDSVVGDYTSDTEDLLGGMQQASVFVVAQPPAPAAGRPALAAGTLSTALGVSIQPYLEGGRLKVCQPEELAQALAEGVLAGSS